MIASFKNSLEKSSEMVKYFYFITRASTLSTRQSAKESKKYNSEKIGKLQFIHRPVIVTKEKEGERESEKKCCSLFILALENGGKSVFLFSFYFFYFVWVDISICKNMQMTNDLSAIYGWDGVRFFFLFGRSARF